MVRILFQFGHLRAKDIELAVSVDVDELAAMVVDHVFAEQVVAGPPTGAMLELFQPAHPIAVHENDLIARRRTSRSRNRDGKSSGSGRSPA
jgi:hypothetical protein